MTNPARSRKSATRDVAKEGTVDITWNVLAVVWCFFAFCFLWLLLGVTSEPHGK